MVKGVTRRDIVRNADIYEEFKINPIIEIIQIEHLKTGFMDFAMAGNCSTIRIQLVLP